MTNETFGSVWPVEMSGFELNFFTGGVLATKVPLSFPFDSFPVLVTRLELHSPLASFVGLGDSRGADNIFLPLVFGDRVRSPSLA